MVVVFFLAEHHIKGKENDGACQALVETRPQSNKGYAYPI